jgi:anti-anti-sigma factor
VVLNSLPLRFVYTAEQGLLLVRGDIDHHDVDRFAQQLRVCAEAGDVIVDLTDVTYLPSAAVTVMARARQRAAAQGVTVQFVAEHGTIAERVLAMMGLLHGPHTPSVDGDEVG